MFRGDMLNQVGSSLELLFTEDAGESFFLSCAFLFETHLNDLIVNQIT
jgi:hypothetical protein